MKKFKSVICVLLTASLLMGLVACGKETEETKKKKKKKTKETTTTEETEDTTEDTEPSDTESETTSETTEPKATGNPNFNAPEENCKINFTDKSEHFHYAMDLTLDADNNEIGGTVTIDFFNTSDDDWDKLCMRDYSSLFVDAETAGYDGAVETNGAITDIKNIKDGRDGSSIEMTREEDVSVIWLDLGKPLAAGEAMTLTYEFTAKIPTVADRYGVEEGVYNVTNFYPILAVYENDKHDWSHAAFYSVGECFFSEISDYDVKLTVPADYIIASTGVETLEQEDADKWVYSIDAPCVRDFVFCACNDFVVVDDYYEDVHIRVMYSATDPVQSDMSSVEETALLASYQSLAGFGEYFGQYPYDELEVILAPIDAGGMEYPNLVIIEESLAYDPSYFAQVIAHEIGHQWFMGIVGSNSGMEPWLDESFASYTEAAFAEFIEDDGMMEDVDMYCSRKYMDLADMGDYLTDEGYLPINRSHYDFKNDNTYITAVYTIGEMALYQMEEILGRDEFHAVIRTYVQRNAFTNATASDFFDVLFEYAGTDNEELNALIEAVFDI